MNQEKNMSFLQHLEELRWRLVRCAIAIIICATVLFIYQEWIMDNVFLILLDQNFFSYRFLCENFGVCIEKINVEMQSTNVAGQFSYAFMTSILGGIVVSSPYIFYQLWLFIKPALKEVEYKTSRGMIFYVTVLFLLGILFGYFVVTPMTIQFFGSYQISKGIQNIFTIDSYMGLILSTIFYTGLFFLLPVFCYVFARMGILTASVLRKYRRHAIIGVLILSAIITPPDVISQIVVSIPIALLYEIGILAAARVDKKRAKEL